MGLTLWHAGGGYDHIVWNYQEMWDPPQAPVVQLRAIYHARSKGSNYERRLHGEESTKAQTHNLLCLSWPDDENFMIILDRMSGHYHHPSVSQNKVVKPECWKCVVCGDQTCPVLHHVHHVINCGEIQWINEDASSVWKKFSVVHIQQAVVFTPTSHGFHCG